MTGTSHKQQQHQAIKEISFITNKFELKMILPAVVAIEHA